MFQFLVYSPQSTFHFTQQFNALHRASKIFFRLYTINFNENQRNNALPMYFESFRKKISRKEISINYSTNNQNWILYGEAAFTQATSPWEKKSVSPFKYLEGT